MSWTMTLAEIKAHNPCGEGWKKLRKFTGSRKPLSTVVSLEQILESNGVEDALWALRCIKGHGREIQLLAVQCACMVRHLMTDPRSIMALETTALYAEGMEDDSSWDAAEAAAGDAAWAAAGADARAAAGADARAAARAAAEAAAGDAAWAAAGADARAAARAAAEAAAEADAWDAARRWQAEEMVRMIRGEGVYDRSWADNL